MDFFASGSKPQHPAEWDIWLQLPRPRVVRRQKRQRFRITLILTAAIAIATLLLGARFAEWQTHPTSQMMDMDHLGRPVTASCPDNTRSFSEGMEVPVFFNSKNPESDQIALCATPYEVAIADCGCSSVPIYC
jgi:hypothetical protein